MSGFRVQDLKPIHVISAAIAFGNVGSGGLLWGPLWDDLRRLATRDMSDLALLVLGLQTTDSGTRSGSG